jgi:hypothetical protein
VIVSNTLLAFALLAVFQSMRAPNAVSWIKMGSMHEWSARQMKTSTAGAKLYWCLWSREKFVQSTHCHSWGTPLVAAETTLMAKMAASQWTTNPAVSLRYAATTKLCRNMLVK